MKNLMIKELRLAASPLSLIFLAASLMTLLPGYPILMSAFLISFGLFHSFQNARESNDVLYSMLLPIKKTDFVKVKYLFAFMIQVIGLCLCSALTAVRMTALSNAAPYINNALMNATPVYIAFLLLIFTAFNVLFIGGFFRSAYKIGIPFLKFGITTALLVIIAETLHHLPGLGFLNTPEGDRLGIQFAALAAACAIYIIATILSCRSAEKRFDLIDL